METLIRCGLCHVKKPKEAYAPKPGGGLFKLCTDCREKSKAKKHEERQGGGVLQNPSAPAQSSSLDLFLKIPKKSGRTWTLGQAEYLAMGLQDQIKDGMPPDYKKLTIKYGSGHTEGACKAIISELKRAAQDEKKHFKKGMPSIKIYFEAGRPYLSTNEILYKPKK